MLTIDNFHNTLAKVIEFIMTRQQNRCFLNSFFIFRNKELSSLPLQREFHTFLYFCSSLHYFVLLSMKPKYFIFELFFHFSNEYQYNITVYLLTFLLPIIWRRRYVYFTNKINNHGTLANARYKFNLPYIIIKLILCIQFNSVVGLENSTWCVSISKVQIDYSSEIEFQKNIHFNSDRRIPLSGLIISVHRVQKVFKMKQFNILKSNGLFKMKYYTG